MLFAEQKVLVEDLLQWPHPHIQAGLKSLKMLKGKNNGIDQLT